MDRAGNIPRSYPFFPFWNLDDDQIRLRKDLEYDGDGVCCDPLIDATHAGGSFDAECAFCLILVETIKKIPKNKIFQNVGLCCAAVLTLIFFFLHLLNFLFLFFGSCRIIRLLWTWDFVIFRTCASRYAKT